MGEQTFYLLSLGCAKNSVDSQSMSELLLQNGYRPVAKPALADILIVNTCGFIQPAREESISALRKLAKKKKPNQKLIAAGCLSERYRQALVDQVPGLDGIMGTRRWMDIIEVVNKIREKQPYTTTLYHLPDSPTVGTDEHGILRGSLQGGSAYLKIADGCRRPCAFCAIPLIKGTIVSRPIQAIISDAKILHQIGVKEIILIAQDTTDYGHDLGFQDGLAVLLEQFTTEIPDSPWIRILYAYPGYVTDRLIRLMASSPKILHYLDIPLQHAHPETLRRMKRPANMEWVRFTISKMRAAMPDLALRSTFIVGYPGETEIEFQVLLDFIQEIQFDHVGAFTFSFEQGTTSEPLGDPIPKYVKEERLARLMEIQQTISLSRNQRFVGKEMDVLIEGCEENVSIGRSYRDAPEIDGLVIIEGRLPIGKIAHVQINGALHHDLTAHLCVKP
jgi:ribosomal protein S12 methylthiotransferase